MHWVKSSCSWFVLHMVRAVLLELARDETGGRQTESVGLLAETGHERAPLIAVPAAIAHTVFDGTGIRFHEVPVMRWSVMKWALASRSIRHRATIGGYLLQRCTERSRVGTSHANAW